MTALYYQAIILITILSSFIAGSFLLNNITVSRILGTLTTAFWIFFTLGGAKYFGLRPLTPYSKLWTYQLLEIIILFIVCYGILSFLSSKDKKINEKDKQIEENKNTIKKLLEDKERIDNRDIIEYIEKNQKTVDIKVLSRIPQHIEFLYDTLQNAQESVCILSGTATSYVVDNEFKDTLMDCLKRGVNIYIGYGYSSSFNKQSKEGYNIKAEQDLKKLVEFSKQKNLKGEIFVAEYKNHSKMLICDDKYVVCGSYNWLSNARGYNAERSYVISDKKRVGEESEIIKKHIRNNLLK